MKTSLLLLLVTVQLLLPAPGCWSSRDAWREGDRDAAVKNPLDSDLSPAELCALLQCQQIKDNIARKTCNRKCAAFSGANQAEVRRMADEAALEPCLLEKCAGRLAASLSECAWRRCGVQTRGRPLRPLRRLATGKRMQGMWPDEFETRKAERAMWPDEYETRNVRRRNDANDGEEKEAWREGAERRAIRNDAYHHHAGTRILMRHARSEEKEPMPVGRDAGGAVKSVQKRWSTRLCMESHCKNAHSKVQYFMCGKAYCHR